MSATTGKLFFRDQNGVIYEFSGNIPVYITDTGIGIDTDDEDDFHLVRSDATIRDYDYDAVINDLAGASAGNVGFALERLLDRNTLMPSEDAAKIIRNVPADNGSIDKLYRTFRFFSDNVSWFGEALSMLMDLEDEGDAATLAAMKLKNLVGGAKEGKSGGNLDKFLMKVFDPERARAIQESMAAIKERMQRGEIPVLEPFVFESQSDGISFPKEQLLKFATFWVILSEKLSGV